MGVAHSSRRSRELPWLAAFFRLFALFSVDFFLALQYFMAMISSFIKAIPSYNGTHLKILFGGTFSTLGGFAYDVEKAKNKELSKKKECFLDKQEEERRVWRRVANYEAHIFGLSKDFADREYERLIDDIKMYKKRVKNGFNKSGYARAKSRLRDLVTRNMSVRMYFLSFSYENEPESFKQMLKDLQNFERRLNRISKGRAFMIAVPERGEENGRLHWHILVMGDIPNKFWFENKSWSKGNIKVKAVKRQKGQTKIDAIVSYICKYMSKAMGVIEGQTRFYYASHNAYTDIQKAHVSDAQVVDAVKVIRKMSTKKNDIKINRQTLTIDDRDLTVMRIFVRNVPYTEIIDRLAEKDIFFHKTNIVKPRQDELDARDLQHLIANFARARFQEKHRTFDTSKMRELAENFWKGINFDSFIETLIDCNSDFIYFPDIMAFQSLNAINDFIKNPYDYWSRNYCVYKNMKMVKYRECA